MADVSEKGLISNGANFAGFNFRFVIPTTIPTNGPFVAFTSREIGPPPGGPPKISWSGMSLPENSFSPWGRASEHPLDESLRLLTVNSD